MRVNRFWNILCKIKIKKKKKKKSFLFRMDEKWNFVDICWGLKYLAHMFNRLIYLQIYQLQNSCNLLYLYKSLTSTGKLYEVNLKTLQYTLKCSSDSKCNCKPKYEIYEINLQFFSTESCQNPPSCKNEGFVAHTCQCLCPSDLTGPTCEQVETDTGVFIIH